MLMSIFFFKQKTAYEMRISDWSSDVCSSDLQHPQHHPDVTISQIAPQQAGKHYRDQDQCAAHGRRSRLAQVRLRAVAADRLSAAQRAEPPTDRKSVV